MIDLKRSAIAALLIASAGVFSVANAQQVTQGTIDVKLTLEEACSIGPGTVQPGAVNNFGTLDFGTHATSIDQTITNAGPNANVDSGISLDVRCNADNPNFKVVLVDSKEGNKGATAGNRTLQHLTESAEKVTYRVFDDSARAQALENGAVLFEDYKHGAPNQTINLYGEADLTGLNQAGNYTDVLNLEITF